ncbi:ATP-binding protein [Actinomadura meridiana]
MHKGELDTPKTSAVLLSCFPQSVRQARAIARGQFAKYSERVTYTVEQCVSELVTNSIVHSDSQFKSGFVSLYLQEYHDRIRVSVFDGGSTEKAPEIAAYDEFATSGRGLVLVESLADAWGTSCDGRGRQVWFEVNTS